MVLVKLQSLPHQDCVLGLTGRCGELDGLLLQRDGLIETSGFRAGHGERVERNGLRAAGQLSRLVSQGDGFRAIANLRVLIRRQNARDINQHLIIVRLDLKRRMEMWHRLDITSEFQ